MSTIDSERWEQRLKRLRRLTRPAHLATLWRTTPLSDVSGFDRGTPIDRYYIERFLEERRACVRGRVLEVMDTRYTQQFGSAVRQSDVLDIDATNPQATVVADLAAGDAIPSDAFDCFILTQTLQFVYDTRSALRHAHRILRPGGTLLCTVPVLSRIDHRFGENEYWRFTSVSCSRLFGEAFPEGEVEIRSYGNVLAAIAFLTGMAREELSRRELDAADPSFPLLVAVRARRSGVA